MKTYLSIWCNIRKLNCNGKRNYVYYDTILCKVTDKVGSRNINKNGKSCNIPNFIETKKVNFCVLSWPLVSYDYVKIAELTKNYTMP